MIYGIECAASSQIKKNEMRVKTPGVAVGHIHYLHSTCFLVKFPGTLMGITNTLGTIPGFLGPSVVGALTDKNVCLGLYLFVFFVK